MVERVVLPNFKVPSAEERKRAIGSMGGTNFKVKKALEKELTAFDISFTLGDLELAVFYDMRKLGA